MNHPTKEDLKRHQSVQSYLSAVTQTVEEGLREKATVEQIRKAILNVCTRCNLPKDPNCDICGYREEIPKRE